MMKLTWKDTATAQDRNRAICAIAEKGLVLTRKTLVSDRVWWIRAPNHHTTPIERATLALAPERIRTREFAENRHP